MTSEKLERLVEVLEYHLQKMGQSNPNPVIKSHLNDCFMAIGAHRLNENVADASSRAKGDK